MGYASVPNTAPGWMMNTDSQGITLTPSDICGKLSALTGRFVLANGNGGDTAQQVKTRFDAKAYGWGLNQVFDFGFNNISDAAHAYAQDIIDVQTTIAAMVAELSHTRFIVMGLFSGPLNSIGVNAAGNAARVTINANLAATYGQNFLNIEPVLVNYDPSNTAAIAGNYIPDILQQPGASSSHPNDLGLTVITNLLLARARRLGMAA